MLASTTTEWVRWWGEGGGVQAAVAALLFLLHFVLAVGRICVRAHAVYTCVTHSSRTPTESS